jgi:hypothetical protein
MPEEPEKCCGNCRKFLFEDASGWGWCHAFKMETFCGVPDCMLYEDGDPSELEAQEREKVQW